MATSINFASLLTFSGAGKAKREKAFASIATTAQLETASRDALIHACKDTLGTTPSDAEIAAVRLQVQVGRVAGRITTKHLATPAQRDAYNADQLAFALDLVTKYAAPPKEGTAARKLRAGQLGRRTVAQHQLVRASDEAWSKLAADIGIGAAQTQKAKDEAKAKRAAHHNDTKAAEFGKDADKPNHTSLVKPSAPVSADEAMAHIGAQATALLAYANKHAALIPTDVGTLVNAFKSGMNKALNEYQLTKAALEAKAA